MRSFVAVCNTQATQGNAACTIPQNLNIANIMTGFREDTSASTPIIQHPDTTVLHLSPFDQSIGRIYVRKLYCFSFPDPSRRAEAVDALHHGISVAVARWPFLTGAVGPAMQSPRRNAVDLVYKTDSEGEPVRDILVIKELSHDEFPFTYSQLAEAGMPPSKMTKEKLSAVPEHPKAGETRPAFSVQASFFEGGLILCVASHHTVFDGNSVRQFLKAFTSAMVDPPNAHAIRKVPFPRRIEYVEGNCTNCSGKCLEVFPELDAREPAVIDVDLSAPRLSTARVLTFSAPHVESLKAAVTQQLALVAEMGSWVSTYDCLAGLIWVAVTRARQHRLSPDSTVKFGMAVDIRSKTDPPLSIDYFGNGIVHTLATSTVAELTSTMDHDSGIDVEMQNESAIDMKTIALAASRIRVSVLKVDKHYVQDRLHVFSQIADPTFTATAYKKALDMSNTGIDMSSWQDQGADLDFGIPGASSKPEFVRKTFSGNEGACNILPRKGGSKGNANWEVLLGLSVADMEAVCAKGELGAWAKGWVE